MGTITAFDDKEGEGKVVMSEKWDFLDEGGGWDLFEENEASEREEVWCGVCFYVGMTKEVWVGTSEGGVWKKKGEKLEKKNVGAGVRTLAIVGNQVILFTVFSLLALII